MQTNLQKEEKISKIHIIIGTKAQLIKMAPIMVELKNRDIEYNFIFTGQHKETMNELLDVFHLKMPDYTLYKGKDITKISQMFFWALRCIAHTLKNKKKIFNNQKGIGLVHGDTFSTLLGAIMAKMGGQYVGYIEAGLRSFKTFNPFPEEIIRRVVSRLADYHFCPGKFAFNNSKKYRGRKINIYANTLYDTLKLAIANENRVKIEIPEEKYCIASIHRFENIFNKKHFIFIINALQNISQNIKVLFILHQPTKQRLQEYGLLDKITKYNIELRPRYDYYRFINLLKHAEFIITDGGSNQEESAYLGKPCLLFRKTTERKEGINENVVISHFDLDLINNFINNYSIYQKRITSSNKNPSDIIVTHLTRILLKNT